MVRNRNATLGEFHLEIVPALLHHARFTFCDLYPVGQHLNLDRLRISAGGIKLRQNEGGADCHAGNTKRDDRKVKSGPVVNGGIATLRYRPICPDRMIRRVLTAS